MDRPNPLFGCFWCKKVHDCKHPPQVKEALAALRPTLAAERPFADLGAAVPKLRCVHGFVCPAGEFVDETIRARSTTPRHLTCGFPGWFRWSDCKFGELCQLRPHLLESCREAPDGDVLLEMAGVWLAHTYTCPVRAYGDTTGFSFAPPRRGLRSAAAHQRALAEHARLGVAREAEKRRLLHSEFAVAVVKSWCEGEST